MPTENRKKTTTLNALLPIRFSPEICEKNRYDGPNVNALLISRLISLSNERKIDGQDYKAGG